MMLYKVISIQNLKGFLLFEWASKADTETLPFAQTIWDSIQHIILRDKKFSSMIEKEDLRFKEDLLNKGIYLLFSDLDTQLRYKQRYSLSADLECLPTYLNGYTKHVIAILAKYEGAVNSSISSDGHEIEGIEKQSDSNRAEIDIQFINAYRQWCIIFRFLYQDQVRADLYKCGHIFTIYRFGYPW